MHASTVRLGSRQAPLPRLAFSPELVEGSA